MEEIACEEHFERSHRKAADGRFIVKLPFKNGLMLGESRNTALRCLTRLEIRLAKNDNLNAQYNEFMDELLTMGHMELAASPPKSSC